MAVRHGYGKIAGTDALVFAYDTGDTRNSYRGEPTENLITSDGIDFSTISSYNELIRSRVEDSESPSGYACEMEYPSSGVNAASRIQFGASTNIPTSGNVFISVKAKYAGGPTSNITPRVYTGYTWYDLAPLDGGSQYLTSEYRRFGVYAQLGTSSGGPLPAFSMTHNNSNNQAGQKTRWHSPQVEVKTHVTPFTAGTRSSTQGLLDLAGNSTVNLTNVSFDSNANIEFDGSNDNFTVNVDSVIRGYTAVTFESVHRDTSGTGGATPYSLLTSPNTGNEADGFWHHWVLGGQWYWRLEDNVNGEVGGIFSGATPFQTGNWYHVVAVVKTNTILYYLNGTLLHTVNTSFAWANLRTDNTAYLYLGSGYGDNYYFAGNLPVFKMYNKELTADEVRNNYRHYKTRFNI